MGHAVDGATSEDVVSWKVHVVVVGQCRVHSVAGIVVAWQVEAVFPTVVLGHVVHVVVVDFVFSLVEGQLIASVKVPGLDLVLADFVVLTAEDYLVVVRQRDAVALGVLDFSLETDNGVPFTIEDGDVEVVVVVAHNNLVILANVHPDGEVGDALPSNVPQVISLVVVHLGITSSLMAALMKFEAHNNPFF